MVGQLAPGTYTANVRIQYNGGGYLDLTKTDINITTDYIRLTVEKKGYPWRHNHTGYYFSESEKKGGYYSLNCRPTGAYEIFVKGEGSYNIEFIEHGDPSKVGSVITGISTNKNYVIKNLPAGNYKVRIYNNCESLPYLTFSIANVPNDLPSKNLTKPIKLNFSACNINTSFNLMYSVANEHEFIKSYFEPITYNSHYAYNNYAGTILWFFNEFYEYFVATREEATAIDNGTLLLDNVTWLVPQLYWSTYQLDYNLKEPATLAQLLDPNYAHTPVRLYMRLKNNSNPDAACQPVYIPYSINPPPVYKEGTIYQHVTKWECQEYSMQYVYTSGFTGTCSQKLELFEIDVATDTPILPAIKTANSSYLDFNYTLLLSPSKKYRVKLTVVDINGNEHIYWKKMEPPTDTFISEQKIYAGVGYGPICDASAGDGASIYLKMGHVMGDNASGYIIEMLSAPTGYDPTQPHPIAGQKMMAVGDEITLPNNYNSMYFYPTNYHPTTYKPATTATEDGRVNLPAGTYTFKISHICDPAHSVTDSVTVKNFTVQRPTLNKHVTGSTIAIEQQCINSKVYPFRGNGITDYVIDQNGSPMRVRMTFFVGGVEKSQFYFEPSLYSNPYHNYQNYSFEVPRAEVTIEVKYDAYVERDGSYEWCPLGTSEFTLPNRHLNYEEPDYFGYRCQDGTSGKIGIKAINGQGPYTYELRTSEGGSLVDQKASVQAGEKIVFDITHNAALSYYMTIKDEACPGEEYYETILLADLGAPTVNPYAKKFCTNEPSISKDISPINGVNGVIADGMMSYTWTIKTDNPNIQGLVANPTTPQAQVMSGALTLAPGVTTPQIAVYKVMPTYGVCEGQPFEITLVVSPCINYWQGATDTDWNKTSNWTESTIPQTGEDVIFATEANNPYFKTIPNSGAAKNNLYVPITEQSITIGDLTNESDKALVVPAGAGLVVTGEVTGSETDPSKIVIKSDATNPSGSFFINNANACDMAVYATINMYSKATKLTNPITFKDENADSPDKGKEEILTHTW